jgi:hypothetical protein
MHIAIQVTFAYVGALIVHLLTLAKAQLDLYEAALEVDRERDQGIALLPDSTIDALDLLGMEEQFLLPVGIVLKRRRREDIFRDMEIPDPDFPAPDFRECVGKG